MSAAFHSADVDDVDGHDYEQRLAYYLHHGCIVLKWRCFVVCLDGGLIDVSFVFGIE